MALLYILFQLKISLQAYSYQDLEYLNEKINHIINIKILEITHMFILWNKLDISSKQNFQKFNYYVSLLTQFSAGKLLSHQPSN